MTVQHESESLTGSFERLGRDLGDLIRAELSRFRRRAEDDLRKIAAALIWLAAAAVMGLALLGVFTAFLILVLNLVFAPWISALIVTVTYGVATAGLLTSARVKFRSLSPLFAQLRRRRAE